MSTEEAAELALRAERAAREVDSRITNTDGASVGTYEGQFVMGNTRGFLVATPIRATACRWRRSPAAATACSAITGTRPSAIRPPGLARGRGSLCRRAHAVAPVGAPHSHRQVPGAVRGATGPGPVGALTQAANGGALYRKASFLLDALGKPIFPSHINLTEDPHVRGAMGSSPFDDEGVRTRKRSVVTAGVLEGYFLSSYTARKLGMTTTGNAGGSHNLTFSSTQTQAGDDFEAMLRKMGTGFRSPS